MVGMSCHNCTTAVQIPFTKNTREKLPITSYKKNHMSCSSDFLPFTHVLGVSSRRCLTPGGVSHRCLLLRQITPRICGRWLSGEAGHRKEESVVRCQKAREIRLSSFSQLVSASNQRNLKRADTRRTAPDLRGYAPSKEKLIYTPIDYLPAARLQSHTTNDTALTTCS